MYALGSAPTPPRLQQKKIDMGGMGGGRGSRGYILIYIYMYIYIGHAEPAGQDGVPHQGPNRPAKMAYRIRDSAGIGARPA